MIMIACSRVQVMQSPIKLSCWLSPSVSPASGDRVRRTAPPGEKHGRVQGQWVSLIVRMLDEISIVVIDFSEF